MPRWSPFDAVADRRLVQGLNEGDDDSLALLYEAYAERLYDYALSMLGDYKAAADTVHDTFIDASRRAPRMRDHARLRSWLYGAARRRCVQRGRVRVLYWEPDLDFGDEAPAMERADEPSPGGKAARLLAGIRPGPASGHAGGDTGEAQTRRNAYLALPPSSELRSLLESSLARLETGEQEALLLAVRHGLLPAEIAAVLGVSSRRAAARVAQARPLLEAAYDTELILATERCAAANRRTPAAVASGAGARSGRTGRRPVVSVSDHCADCERRAGVYAAALLALAPSPVLPAALRHRVVHTATDSELAVYRADIAARGGGLTPDGLPSQPDMPSPFTRRWMFAGGGMAGALATAVLAVLLMGPGGIGTPTISWPPFQTGPQPSITEDRPDERGGGEDVTPRPPQARAPGDTARPTLSPTPGSPSPGHRSPAPTTPVPTRPGTLAVFPAKVEMYGTKTAQVRLTANEGPVSWNAVASSEKVTVSQPQGGLDQDAQTSVTISLRAGLLNLPGEATVTFIDSETGETRDVAVVWGASLL